ncbi:ATP-binding protein [Rhodocyclus tenuis]|uniref:ATP-binding protein n=1 Tax=Rhodocyclus tenuis TaxID=1066 RepID=UPI001904D113|nr:hypothetical protein [Rhodocyclus tenuis]
MKNWGIRTRVLLLALLPAVSIAIMLAGYLGYRTSSEFERDLRDYGIGLSRQLAAVAEFSTYSRDRDALRNIALTALDEPNVVATAIFDGEGTAIASGGSAPARLQPIPLDNQPLILIDTARRIVFAAPIFAPRYDVDDPLVAETAGITAKRAPQGTIGWITLEISRDAAEQRKREALFFTLLSSLLVLAFGGGLALVLSRQVTQPILRLEQAVARIQRGELEARVPATSGGDLQRLEEGMNAMAEALSEGRSLLQARIREATRELQAKKDEAERASVAKSRFLAAASHDLRQPLHALSLFSADLQRAAEMQDQQRLRQLSERVAESVEAMSGLLDALLDISRLDIGGVAVQPENIALNELLTRLEARFARSASDAGLRLRFRPSGAQLFCDPVLLERLLTNLIANAIRYTRRGGILVAARKRGRDLRIEVRDSGIGIAREHQQAVFEEFFQVGNNARVRGEGLGLGLAIVSRLARLLDTRIELRSQSGQGSVFAVTLPLSAAGNTPGSTEASAARTPAEKSPLLRLLLLQPESPELQNIAVLAESWGYTCKDLSTTEVGVETPADGQTVIVAQAGKLAELAAMGVTLPLIVLGGDGRLPAGAHRLPLPLRPAKLRALLAQLLSSADRDKGAAEPARPGRVQPLE